MIVHKYFGYGYWRMTACGIHFVEWCVREGAVTCKRCLRMMKKGDGK